MKSAKRLIFFVEKSGKMESHAKESNECFRIVYGALSASIMAKDEHRHNKIRKYLLSQSSHVYSQNSETGQFELTRGVVETILFPDVECVWMPTHQQLILHGSPGTLRITFSVSNQEELLEEISHWFVSAAGVPYGITEFMIWAGGPVSVKHMRASMRYDALYLEAIEGQVHALTTKSTVHTSIAKKWLREQKADLIYPLGSIEDHARPPVAVGAGHFSTKDLGSEIAEIWVSGYPGVASVKHRYSFSNSDEMRTAISAVLSSVRPDYRAHLGYLFIRKL